MIIERRFVGAASAPVAIAARADGGSTITGYAAVFYRAGVAGTEYQLSENAVERISRGAFTRALKEGQDVRALYNHDADNLLGRTASGTCRLTIDAVGLRYEIEINEDDPDHVRVLEKINRGDLSGSSFAFVPRATTWEDRRDLPSIRWIDDADLYDVGPVTYPAYQSTTTNV